LLAWAIAFCDADNLVQKARAEWSQLHAWHDSYAGVCCLPFKTESDPYLGIDPIDRKALPRAKWCEQCLDYMANHVSYYEALWERRTAKAGMKRTAKRLAAKRQPVSQ